MHSDPLLFRYSESEAEILVTLPEGLSRGRLTRSGDKFTLSPDERLGKLLECRPPERLASILRTPHIQSLWPELRFLISHLTRHHPTTRTRALSETVVDDISSLGWETFEALSADLSELTIRLKDEDLCLDLPFTFRLPHDYPSKTPLGVADCGGLPAVPRLLQATTLAAAVRELKSELSKFGSLWKSFRELDEKCWVVEPENPSPYGLYRRVMLTASTSVCVNYQPNSTSGIPGISFLGPESRVVEMKGRLNRNILMWEPRQTVMGNLSNILDLDFPPPPSHEESQGGELGCQICFSPSEDEGGAGATIVCPKESCARSFHRGCIVRWFYTLPHIRKSFNVLFGPCPFCRSELSVKDN